MAYQLVTYCHRRHSLSCRTPVVLGLIVLTLGLVSGYPQEYGQFPDNVPGSSSYLAPPPGAKVDRQTSTIRPDPNTWRRGSVIKWQSEDGLARGKLAESEGTADVKTDNARVRSKDYIAGGSKEWMSRDGLSRAKVTAYRGQSQYSAVSTQTKHQEYDPGTGLSSRLADFIAGKVEGLGTVGTDFNPDKIFPESDVKFAPNLDLGLDQPSFTSSNTFNNERSNYDTSLASQPQNSQPYNGSPPTSNPFSGSPVNPQTYNSPPINAQPYNGSPVNSQPYNGSPASSQPYGSPAISETYNGAPARNSQSNYGSPASSQQYNGSPDYT